MKRRGEPRSTRRGALGARPGESGVTANKLVALPIASDDFTIVQPEKALFHPRRLTHSRGPTWFVTHKYNSDKAVLRPRDVPRGFGV